jgi:uncharacterized protein
VTRKRLVSSLAEALQGEVDPRSLAVDVTSEQEELHLVVSYTLATLGHSERHRILLAPAGGAGGPHG